MRNHIAGEVQYILHHFSVPYSKSYLKAFRDVELINGILRQIRHELPQYDVKLTELEHEWILSIEEEVE